MGVHDNFHDEHLKYTSCPPVLAACIRRLNRDPTQLDWLPFYIPPLVRTNTRLPGTSGLKPNRELTEMPIGTCLGLSKNLILCGAPGSGRATLSHVLARLSIQNAADRAGCHPDIDLLYELALTPIMGSLDELVSETALSSIAIKNWKENSLLIVDGRRVQHEWLQERIRALPEAMQTRSNARIMVLADGEASHWMHAIHDPAWTAAEIQPLNEARAGWFMERWMGAFSGNMNASSSQALHHFKPGWLDSQRWIQYPLDLALALLYFSKKVVPLPKLKEKFFSETMKVLIGSDSAKEGDRKTLQQELGALAFFSLIGTKGTSDESLHKDYISGGVIQAYLQEPDGILEIQAERLPTFIHNTLRQHLAAGYLADLPVDQMIPFCRKMLISNPEVVRTALILVHLEQPKKYPLILDTILAEESDRGQPALILAACQSLSYLWEYLGSMGSHLSATTTRCRDALLSIISSEGCHYRQRVGGGNILAVIGDGRFNPDVWQLPNDDMLGFIEIPEGDFYMGTDEADVPVLIETLGVGSDWDSQTLGDMLSIEPNLDDLIKGMGLSEGWESLDPIRILPQWYKRETPQHRLHLPVYYIAHFPVTVSQFQRFVLENGYPFALTAYSQERMNHPITGVQWTDAVAYCRWLHQKLVTSDRTPEWMRSLLQGSDGWRVTLPSEAEWEKAARGPADGKNPKRLFPWGDAFDERKANLKEAAIGATSSVGCFPEGASPFGVQDLAGNVWEWTRSMWGEEEYRVHYPYPYDPHDGREGQQPERIHALRVLRGASYNNYQRYARCATRRSPFPELKSSARGFRVAISRSEI